MIIHIPLIYQTMNYAKGQIDKVRTSKGFHCQVVKPKGVDFKAINDFLFVRLECSGILFLGLNTVVVAIHQYNEDDFIF